jgi:CRISP-associated protein Cas1
MPDQADIQPIPQGPALTLAAIAGQGSLLAAWGRVLANRGAHGGDGIGLEAFGAQLEEELRQLAAELLGGAYLPGRLRLVPIPKRSGGRRMLRIPPIRDRVAQTAVAMALGPALDAEMEPSSYAYRPGRSVAQAVRRVAALRAQGHEWVAESDIDDFFDNIPHERLLTRLRPHLRDPALEQLIALWLEAWGEDGRGLPQGGPLSPLLANFYLDRVDEAIATRGVRLVRYADDFVLLCRSAETAERALARMRALLAEEGLRLNPEKTRLVHVDKGFRFLGHLFVRSLVLPERREAAPEAAAEPSPAALGPPSVRGAHGGPITPAELGLAEPRHDLSPGMRVLYVLEPGRVLGLRNRAVSVTDGEEEVLATMPDRLDRIEIGPRVTITDAALRRLPAEGLPITLVDGLGRPQARLEPPFGPGRALRHLAQARAVLEEGTAVAFTRAIVEARIHNQRSLLRRVNRRRRDAAVARACLALTRTLRKLPEAGTVEALRGHEGAAAALFWPAWGACLLHGWTLEHRRRSAEADPPNIVLNVLASLLIRDMEVAVGRAGLHPGFGILHRPGRGNPSCALDLVEPLRGPLAETAALYALNNRVVGRPHFERMAEEGWRLTQDGMKALIRCWEGWVDRPVRSPFSGAEVSWRRLMVEQAEHFAEACEAAAGGAPPTLLCYHMDH